MEDTIYVIIQDEHEVFQLYPSKGEKGDKGDKGEKGDPGSGGEGAVDSVNGETGVVVLDTDNISEGTNNKYYTESRVSLNSSVQANTAKIGVTTEEENTINSIVSGEPTGSDAVLNVVSLTQAEYDAGTPVATTFYIITDA